SVVNITTTLHQIDVPTLEFVYVPNDRDAFKKLKEVLLRYLTGTRIVFVRNSALELRNDLSRDLPKLRFGVLTRNTTASHRRELLLSFRAGEIDVLVAEHSQERYLSSRHRILDIHFYLPRSLEE
ncbi:hypothetical protein PENTCL1PPCAC_29693, partial [Pristionchus entomophagus]